MQDPVHVAKGPGPLVQLPHLVRWGTKALYVPNRLLRALVCKVIIVAAVYSSCNLDSMHSLVREMQPLASA